MDGALIDFAATECAGVRGAVDFDDALQIFRYVDGRSKELIAHGVRDDAVFRAALARLSPGAWAGDAPSALAPAPVGTGWAAMDDVPRAFDILEE